MWVNAFLQQNYRIIDSKTETVNIHLQKHSWNRTSLRKWVTSHSHLHIMLDHSVPLNTLWMSYYGFLIGCKTLLLRDHSLRKLLKGHDKFSSTGHDHEYERKCTFRWCLGKGKQLKLKLIFGYWPLLGDQWASVSLVVAVYPAPF